MQCLYSFDFFSSTLCNGCFYCTADIISAVVETAFVNQMFFVCYRGSKWADLTKPFTTILLTNVWGYYDAVRLFKPDPKVELPEEYLLVRKAIHRLCNLCNILISLSQMNCQKTPWRTACSRMFETPETVTHQSFRVPSPQFLFYFYEYLYRCCLVCF